MNFHSFKSVLMNVDWKWWVTYHSPVEILKNQSSFLYIETTITVIAILALLHALRHGGRYPWLWIAAVFHGITVECVSYFVPDIDNFWHAQATVMLLGQRLPAYILFLYPTFYYLASVAVAKMKLRPWAEPFAVGLFVVLLDVPYDIMGVKLLWWTWHDTDPNIFDRHYWVPWTSYYFHAAFASSFTFLFHGLRNMFCVRNLRFQSAGCFKEFMVAVLTGLLSMPLGVMQFILIYHPLHDQLGIHSEVCVLLLLATYVLLVWSADRCPYELARGAKGSLFDEVVISTLLHYGLLFYLVLKVQPQKMRSTGWHQPVGPCGVKVPVHTPFGQVLSKDKFLCVENYSEGYFRLNCLGKKDVVKDSEWYTICGTEFPNHIEYLCVVGAFCFLGLFSYWQAHFRSGPLPPTGLRKIHKD